MRLRILSALTTLVVTVGSPIPAQMHGQGPVEIPLRVHGGLLIVEAKASNGNTLEFVAAGIQVTDTGSGIPAALTSKIFDRFYRVDSSRSRQYGGAGLGLTIAKVLAEVQGGRIEVQSTMGKGSKFTLWLPAAAKAKVAVKRVSHPAAAAG